MNEVPERGDPRREEAIRTLLDVADVQPGTEALLLASSGAQLAAGGRTWRGARAAGGAASPTNFLTWLTLGFRAQGR